MGWHPEDNQFGAWYSFLKVMAAIFIVETAVMLLMQYTFSNLSGNQKIFLDGVFLTFFLSPLLYVLLVRPLLQRRKAEYQRSQLQLQNAFIELCDRQSFIESVLAGIQSGIMVTDLDLRINLANQYALEFFGKSNSELEGVKLEDICPRIYEIIHAGTDADEVTEVREYKSLTVGFKRFDLKRSDGVLAGHIISFIDISEMEKVRREMRQKERLATMGEVVARVAHEMRNPLFGVTAAAQILAMEMPLTMEQKALMNSILSEAKRMNKLVDELLDCSKEMRLKKIPFDLIKGVKDSLNINEVLVMERKLVLCKALSEEKITVTADPERIRQVLVNLLKNAIDASPVGGTITVDVEVCGVNALIRLTDSGQGIPEADMEKIFDIFYTTKKNGTGLGLAISRKIMTAHGGILTAGNNPMGGAVFTVTLPMGYKA